MNYVFLVDLAEFSADQLLTLQAIGCGIQIASNQLDDEQYTRLQWLLTRKERLNLAAPTTFNEKIQWLKLHHRKQSLPALVDKLCVRQYVAKTIGEQYLNELYATGASLEEIDPAILPQRFIVKCTHGSNWNIVVRDKATMDWLALIQQMDRWLRINYYDLRREWVYQHLKPRVVVERLMEVPEPPGLLDYKMFCFDGRVQLVQVDIDRSGDHRRNLYDLEWQRLPCKLRYPPADHEVPRPRNLSLMIELAESLARGFPFVRVDLYDYQEQVVFGEMTFFPGNGFEDFVPEEYDQKLGALIRLPERTLQDE